MSMRLKRSKEGNHKEKSLSLHLQQEVDGERRKIVAMRVQLKAKLLIKMPPQNLLKIQRKWKRLRKKELHQVRSQEVVKRHLTSQISRAERRKTTVKLKANPVDLWKRSRN